MYFFQQFMALGRNPLSLHPCLGGGSCLHRCSPKLDLPPATSAWQTDLDSSLCHSEAPGQQPLLLGLLGSHSMKHLRTSLENRGRVRARKGSFWSFGVTASPVSRRVGGSPGHSGEPGVLQGHFVTLFQVWVQTLDMVGLAEECFLKELPCL